MTTVSAEALQQLLEDIFAAAGTPRDIAVAPAEHLVLANLSGYDSHGVVHITHYTDELAAGIIQPASRPEVVERRASSIVLDAHHGWGHYAGLVALDLAMETAQQTGVAAVSIRNCTHIGRLGHYVEVAAARGFISMVTWGAGKPITWGPPKPAFHLAAPFGGAAPALSTNPFAFGVPTGDGAPFVADFATTVIANAKAWVLRDRGEPLPPGSAVNRDGVPTTDPAEYMDGGSLMIFGGHKGYGISLLTCLLGGLTGAAAGADGMEGPFFLVIDPAAFTPADDYVRSVRSFLDGMRETPPAPGFDEVLVPGDVEVRSRAQNELKGVDVSPAVQSALRAAGAQYGVEVTLFDERAVEPV